MTIKERVSAKQKMAIEVTFKVLKILCYREAGNRKIVPQAGSAMKETIRIIITIISR